MFGLQLRVAALLEEWLNKVRSHPNVLIDV
jgi:hypothetical protein